MNAFSAEDHFFMQRALRLAERGLFTTTPNPRVGCVLVRQGEIVGLGWHEKAGEPHAEVHALRMAGEAARGATAYVTLEPCSHHGRTPPCADALVRAGVVRVVAAMEDPYHEVAGRGLKRLAEAGIVAESGLLTREAEALNRGFLSRVRRGRPWVTLKAAATLDGKTALENGTSQWITGPAARHDVHVLRARSCALLTGSGTVLADNPMLTVREVVTPRMPLRVVVDSKLVTLPGAAIYGLEAPTVLATAVTDPARHAPFVERGVEVLVLPAAGAGLDLFALMQALGSRGINDLMVEGGSRLNGALVDAGLVDAIELYLAPMLAGTHAQGLFAWTPLERLSDACRVRVTETRMIGPDIRLSLTIESPPHNGEPA